MKVHRDVAVEPTELTRIVHRLEDLESYAKAREFRRRISEFCRTLPKEEMFRLRDQMLRSSRSIAANIAEGHGRHHHQENLQFCRQARGSLIETIEHINCAFDEGYVDIDGSALLRNEAENLLKLLNGYIRYLKSCADSPKSR